MDWLEILYMLVAICVAIALIFGFFYLILSDSDHDFVFEFVRLGSSGRMTVYHDPVTDLLYLSHHGLTPLLGPDGFPITFTEYKELLNETD